MQAVSKRAQVSVGLAYRHFGSKAGLIAAVVEAFYSRLDEAAFKQTKLPSEAWADREKRRIAAYIGFHYDRPFAPLMIWAFMAGALRLPAGSGVDKAALTGTPDVRRRPAQQHQR